jgi:hypothetical protein
MKKADKTNNEMNWYSDTKEILKVGDVPKLDQVYIFNEKEYVWLGRYTLWYGDKNGPILVSKHEDERNFYNAFPPSPQDVINVLKDELLGKDWYCVDPLHTDQINEGIMCEILDKYKKGWRKRYK